MENNKEWNGEQAGELATFVSGNSKQIRTQTVEKCELFARISCAIDDEMSECRMSLSIL